ncbi:MAG: type transporter [Solirubrobacterales bacterium]|nr:type transporter [Solirubrobacterales bacterium]
MSRPRQRLRRLEPAAMGAVLFRELTVFRRYWRPTTFSSLVEPVIYLLAFGYGFGALVSKVGGLSYKQYVATGVVSTAVLFSSIFPGMFNTFVRYRFQRTYDAMLAAPLDVEELVTAEVTWISLRAGVFGCAPLLVALAFGVRPQGSVVLVPLVGFVTGFGFASFGVTIAGIAKGIDNFNYVTSAVITPLFLIAGAYFPVSGLPAGVRAVAHVNPLYHTVQLVRDSVLHFHAGPDAIHALVLLAFAVVMWRLAIWRLGKRLID